MLDSEYRLRPENVAETIATVRPFGVDICSGVRVVGRLDERKLVMFVERVRATLPLIP